MKHKLIALLLALSILLSFAACGKGGESTDTSGLPGTAEPEKTGAADGTGTVPGTNASETTAPITDAATSAPGTTVPETKPAETKPATTTAPKPTEPEPNFVVLPEAYEDLTAYSQAESSSARVIAAKKDGKYGVIDASGKVIVPFEYTSVNGPTASGHMLAVKDDGTNTVFDAKGNKVLTTDKEVLLGNGVALLYEINQEINFEINFWKPINFYRVEVIQLSTKKTLMTFDYAYRLYACYFDDVFFVLSADGFTEDYSEGDLDGTFAFYDKNGKILYQKKYSNIFLMGSMASVWGGYYTMYEEGILLMRSLNGESTYWIDDYLWNKEDDGTLYSYSDQIGTLVMVKSENVSDPSKDGKYALVDAKTVPDSAEFYDKNYNWIGGLPNYFIGKKLYDSISLNLSEKYFLVSSGDKWGFLSRDGETERLYDDAGDFVNGKAVVLDDGKVYVVNDKLTRISDALTGYTGVRSLGDGLYGVQKDGMWYLAVYSE